MRIASIVVALVHCASAGLVGVAGAEPSKRPNLITIVTDDQALWAMGHYGNGEIHTPNMDRLATEGMTFSNAFVATPVCSPSRATYLTGRWPTEHGISDWISPGEEVGGVGLEGTTWPQVLSDHGYRTALVGKWHLGTKPASHPRSLGFDHFTGFLGGGTKPMNPILEVDGKVKRMKGSTPDILVDDAIAFMRANRDGAFALSLHFRAPHTPYAPVPEEDSKHYAGRQLTIPDFPGLDPQLAGVRTRNYYASVSSIDRNLGRLLAALDQLGLSSETLVVFTSDHGYNEGRHGITTKGNGFWVVGGQIGPMRPNMWDTSLRVPLIVRWPGVVEPGSRTDHMVSNIDMFRSVLGALSIPLPEGSKVHGVDFSPLFRGRSIPDREALFGLYDIHNEGLAHLRMIRTPTHKYVRSFRANFMDELYDLTKDPGERRNLLKAPAGRSKWAKVVSRLRERLTEWQRSIEDPILHEAK